MRITFVNHASFILEYGSVRLICDPWMEGMAFDNGWALLSRTQLRFEDFKEITHIWFSHEHPDHFAPQNLLKIPLEYRKKITVLFQETTDRKVASYCKKLDFLTIVELKQDVLYRLGDDFDIRCDPYTDGDSYALFKAGQWTLLNLNDCVVDTTEKAAELSRSLGRIDVLCTQFGYANKVGNTADIELREDASREKLERIRIQVDHFDPKSIIPFASFVHFCHVENAYMNTGMNRIDGVHSFIQEQLRRDCVVLYPGDTWSFGEVWDSSGSVLKYLDDVRQIPDRSLVMSETVDLRTLIANGNIYRQTLLTGYPEYKKSIEALNAKIHVTDHDQTFALSGKEGFHPINVAPGSCDISLGSQALNYCFCQLWGGDTLNVNARFQVPSSGDYHKFRMFGAVASQLNRKEDIAHLFPTITCRAVSKIRRVLSNFIAPMRRISRS